MKKIILLLLAGSMLATAPLCAGHNLKKLLPKDTKDNVLQVLFGAGMIAAGGYGFLKCRSHRAKTIAALISVACACGFLKKTYDRGKNHNYDSTLEFLGDDMLAKLATVWNKLNLHLAFNLN